MLFCCCAADHVIETVQPSFINIFDQEDGEDGEDGSLGGDLLVHVMTFLSHKSDIPNLFIAGMAQKSLRSKLVKVLHATFRVLVLEKHSLMIQNAPKDIKALWNSELEKFKNCAENADDGNRSSVISGVSNLCIILEYLEISKTLTSFYIQGESSQQQQILWPACWFFDRDCWGLFVAPGLDRELVYLCEQWFPRKAFDIQREMRIVNGQPGNRMRVNEFPILIPGRLGNWKRVARFPSINAESQFGYILPVYLPHDSTLPTGVALQSNSTQRTNLYLISRNFLENVTETRRMISQSPKNSWLLNYQKEAGGVPCYWNKPTIGGSSRKYPKERLMVHIRNLVQLIEGDFLRMMTDGPDRWTSE